MFKKFYNFLHAHRFIHYFVAGSSAFVLDFVLLLVFKEFLKLKPTLAVAFSQAIVLIYVFCAHKFWSFKSSGNTTRQLKRFVLLLAGNYFFSIFWMWLWIEAVGITWPLAFGNHSIDAAYLVARVFNVILATSWNFFLYKFWVYRMLTIDGNINLA